MINKDTKRTSKILLLNGDKVLLLYSDKLRKFHLPGGHLKLGETYKACVYREVKEETNLDIKTCRPVFKKFNFVLYLGYPKGGSLRLSEEHSKYVWAKIEDAHKYELCNFTKKDIKGLQRYWSNKHKNKPCNYQEEDINYIDENLH
jgi:8-oxo-dGTP pyrophosphatase MutT (NUDIX family)